MGKIILVRHGETELNRRGVYFGRLDPPLTEVGRDQLKRTREILKGHGYVHIHSSPLARAHESARILHDRHHEIGLDERLMELNFGIFEGLSYREIQEKYPKECRESQENWKDYNFFSGESPREMQKRAVEFIEGLDKEKDHLVVTHWGVISTILSHYLSNELDGYWKFDIKNGGIAVIEFAEGFPILRGLNIGG